MPCGLPEERGGRETERPEQRTIDPLAIRLLHESVAPQSQYTMYFSKATTFAWGSFMQLFGGQTYSFSDYSQALQTGPLKLT